MALYEDYNSTPANNSSAPPIGAPEGGTRLNQVSDILRRLAASVGELGRETPKLPSNATSLGITDRTQIKSAAYAETADFASKASEVPVGGVVPFIGENSDIPANYRELNGQTVTINYPDGARTVTLPQSRGKYARSVGGVVEAGDVGGNNSATTSTEGGHDHGGDTGNTALSIAQMPLHGHPTRVSSATASSASQDTNGGMMLQNTSDSNFNAHTGSPGTSAGDQVGGTGGGQSHDHTIGEDGDHSHTVSFTPEWFAMIWMIRIS